jgi:predicted enzyme related to lactoylglutathione lyase
MAGTISGEFCMPELHTPDIDGAKRFYGELFGWTAVDVPDARGYYALFQVDGTDVAGLRRVAGATHRWIAHVLVDSIAETAARATQRGATASAPVRTPGLATTSLVRDPEGAEIGLWEAGGHPGARLTEATGSMWWVELLARDIHAARAFYTGVFGWSVRESSKIGFPYTVFQIGDRQAGGAAQHEPEWGVTSRWQVLFAVAHFETAVKTAAAQGGRLGFWRDVPYNGRFGILNDPGGAVVCIMDPSQVVEPS